MSDGSLSQDEIDALLQGSGGMDFDTGPTPVALDDQQTSQFEQLIRGTVGSQTSNLSMLVSNEVKIEPISIRATTAEELLPALTDDLVTIHINLTEGTPGTHMYLLGGDAAVAIAGPMMGQEGVELDDAAVNALQEAFSQISGPVVTALGERAGATVMNEPPVGKRASKDSAGLPGDQFVAITYSITVGEQPSVELTEVFDLAVVQAALGGSSAPAEPAGGFAGGGLADLTAAPAAPAEDGGGLLAGLAGDDSGGMGGLAGAFGGSPNVQSVQFPNLTAAGGPNEQGNIGLLMDVFMEMTVELGRTRKLIKEILGMGEGTIIELDKLAGEPVDILVNHKLIAKGEVVVIDENFGVRVTEIVSPIERMGNGMS